MLNLRSILFPLLASQMLLYIETQIDCVAEHLRSAFDGLAVSNGNRFR